MLVCHRSAVHEYGAGQAMVVTVEMPSRGAVSGADAGELFLGFVLVLDLSVLHELIEQMPKPPQGQTPASSPSLAGVCVVDLSAEALDCLCFSSDVAIRKKKRTP